MKTIFKVSILIVILNAMTSIVPLKATAQVAVSFQVFYDELSPYGMWVENPEYGYVWVPNVDAGFTPYGTNGYWVFTDAGWTWVSNYSWGWAPFHYGRWFTDPIYGPMWVPGNEWGPGWVCWRRSNNYYGWAPIEPGISISMAYSDGYHVPNDRWCFVRNENFGRRNMNNYYVNRSNNVTIMNHTTVINNTYVDNARNVKYNSGPPRTEVQTRTGRVFEPVAIKESAKPGQSVGKNQLQLYRPQFSQTNSAEAKPAPVKVASLKDVKPPAQRTQVNQPVKTNQPARTQQPARNQPSQQPRNNQPAQQPRNNQPAQQPRNNQPAHQQRDNQPAQQPRNNQPAQQPRNNQPAHQQRDNQPAQQPRNNQPAHQQRDNQPAQQPRNNQPPQQPQRQIHPSNRPPVEQQHPQQPSPNREEQRPPH